MQGMLARILLLCLSAYWLTGCSDSDTPSAANDGQAEAVDGAAVVKSSPIAMVGGTAITEQALDQAMERFFSSSGEIRDRQRVEQQVLKSLISSRAIALLSERELDNHDRQDLALKVAAYREELLVKRYLQQHATPQPVTSEMVETYYQEHQQEFGGGTNNSFELIQTTRKLTEEERSRLIKLLGGLSQEADWESWAQRHRDEPIGWRSLNAKSELLKQPLRSLVEATEVGATSALHIDEQLTLVKVNARDELPAKPLTQVSAEIRRKLAPVKMKQAIKEISTQAQAETEIKVVHPDYEGVTGNK
jgi:hypothetical protein